MAANAGESEGRGEPPLIQCWEKWSVEEPLWKSL